jgi:S1-C subfamily serine protease
VGDRVNWVDLLLVLLAVLLAWTGWRHGLISGVLSFVGFVAGALLGILVAPHVVAWLGLSGLPGLAVVLVVILLLAGAGNAVLVVLGSLVRNRLVWRPVRLLDSVGGALFGVLSLAVVAWLLASALVVLPEVAISRQVRSSAVLGVIDDSVPEQARTWVSDLGHLLDDSGLPRVFAGLGAEPVVPVAEPDPALLKDPAVRAAWDSLVKVEGIAPECGTRVDGSGFVYAPERVMTNAHVVAGTERLMVSLRGTGEQYPARVVYLDPELDVAVLAVPGLGATPLDFAGAARSGTPGVVVGFPSGGPLAAVPARVRAQIAARGKDIYGRGDVTRQVYSLRAQIRPGNSGGPLLSSDGQVYGVVFAAGVDDPDTGYALTAAQVEDAAEAGRDATAELLTGSCRTR